MSVVETAKTVLEAAKQLPEIDHIPELISRAVLADDYRQIMNAMGKHVFGYYGQIQKEELERYWSSRDDIVYAHGSMAYYGRENVYNYYTGMTAAMKEQGRKTAKAFYGQDFDPQYGPGYKVMNMLLSPYVEIAADRQTARGVWMAYAYMTHLNPEDGKPDTSLGLSRYSCEFIKEDGQWKIWHRVDHMESGLKYAGMGQMMPPLPQDDGDKKSDGPKAPMPMIKYIGQKTLSQMSDTGSPCEPAYPEPKIPEPYETWTEEKSYIVVEHDGYTAARGPN